MSDRDGTTPAVWDPTANGGAGGWVRRGAAGAPTPSDAEETAVLPPIPAAPPAGPVPPQGTPGASAPTPTEFDQPVVRPYFPGGGPTPPSAGAEMPTVGGPQAQPGPRPGPGAPATPFVPPGVHPLGTGAAPGSNPPTAPTQPGTGPAAGSAVPAQPMPAQPAATPPANPFGPATAPAASAGAEIPTVTGPQAQRGGQPPAPQGAEVPTVTAPGAQPSGQPGPQAAEIPTVTAPQAQPGPQPGPQAPASPFAPPAQPGAPYTPPGVQPGGYSPNFQVPLQAAGVMSQQTPGHQQGVPPQPGGPAPYQRPDFGGYQPPPVEYAEDGGSRRMPTGVLVVIVLVVAALLGVGAVWGLGLGRSSHGTAAPSSSPVASGTGNGSPSGAVTPSGSPGSAAPSASASAGAQAQAQAVDSLLSQSRNVRQSIGSAASDVSNCTNLAAAQGAFQSAANTRQNLANQASTLDVSQLPNGSTLMQELAQAERDSATADNQYAAYAGSLATGNCTPNAPAPQSVAAANNAATTDKNTFVVEWNQIAGQYGLPSWTKNDF